MIGSDENWGSPMPLLKARSESMGSLLPAFGLAAFVRKLSLSHSWAPRSARAKKKAPQKHLLGLLQAKYEDPLGCLEVRAHVQALVEKSPPSRVILAWCADWQVLSGPHAQFSLTLFSYRLSWQRTME